MRNLRLFIIKNYFFFLFLIFQLISLSFLVTSNDHQRTSFLNSSNHVVGFIMEKASEVGDYMHLKRANDQLMAENAYLRNLLKDTKYEIRKGRIEIRDSNTRQQYTYLPAKVINNTVVMMDNYFTLNRGSLDGIKEGMGVTNGSSVVGVVRNVSDHFSTVMSVLNKNFVLSVKLKKTNDFGLIKWEGTSEDEVYLTHIPVDAKVAAGDTVVTRGATSKFPPNVLVGIVEEVTTQPGSMHHYIRLRLATDFNAVYQVYVIENKLAAEQIQLESEIPGMQ